MDPRLLERDRAEVERSAEEAKNLVAGPISPAQIERYLNPPADTAYHLEYAFHLLGDVRGKTVLDLGCGAGQNLLPLVKRGARAIGIDVSPDLIALARKRLAETSVEATLKVGSAYDTGLPDSSVDVIFCISLIHHLDIGQVCREMLRILSKGATVILQEPIRFSSVYSRLRGLLPARDEISAYEHPLTLEEVARLSEFFDLEGTRYFRLPLVPLLGGSPPNRKWVWRIDRWLLRHWTITRSYATCIVTKGSPRAELVQSRPL